MINSIIDTENSAVQLAGDEKIVVVGGGHGLSSVLRGLKYYTSNTAAIVTMADNGGSSGELRRNMGVAPLGDIRNCLAALSPDEELLTHVLQYRFSTSSGVGPHSLGNLLLSAMINITGNVETGINELSNILNIRGKVTPSTLDDINLSAEIESVEDNNIITRIINGESQITETGGKIRDIWIVPEKAKGNPVAQHEILSADLIVLGPGSLYTSIIPNLLVNDISGTILASHAPIIYICNMTTQKGETDDMNCLDHVNILKTKIPDLRIDAVVCNNFHDTEIPGHISWVKITQELLENYNVFQGDLVDSKYPWRHDSQKLVKVLSEAYKTVLKEQPGKKNMPD